MPAGIEPPSETVADAARYCSETVRTADKDRYLASLFAPDDKRDHLMALYAFSTEVARIREVTSEPAMGEFRLQWWRDTIEHIYRSNTPEHPIAVQLAKAIEAGDLQSQGFYSLIDARAFDLYDDPMPSLAALEGYLGETSSALIQMASLILAGPQARQAAESAGHAGVAFGITGLMRALPIHRSRGQCFLPAEMLARSDLTPADIMAGKRSAAIRVASARDAPGRSPASRIGTGELRFRPPAGTSGIPAGHSCRPLSEPLEESR